MAYREATGFFSYALTPPSPKGPFELRVTYYGNDRGRRVGGHDLDQGRPTDLLHDEVRTRAMVAVGEHGRRDARPHQRAAVCRSDSQGFSS